jgi:BMFP domain-containing protein YqiC
MADDLAGVAGGAFSALAGLRRELGELVRSGTEDVAQKLALASREEVEVLRDLVRGLARENEALAARVAALEARLAPAAGDVPSPGSPSPEKPAADA